MVFVALQALADDLGDLGGIVYRHPEWSTFVQYLAHTYRQMGKPETFAGEIEQILRNTFGFEKLREQKPELANELLKGISQYSNYLQEPGKPLKLVDSTGFSLQSIMTVLTAVGEQKMKPEVWNGDTLFQSGNSNLQTMMGILLRVPELRENLKAVTGGDVPDGDSLALILKDWVNGKSVPQIAETYFLADNGDMVDAMTKCGKNLYGRLAQTAAWGLGALLSITGGSLPEEQLEELRNLPSRVYYGVNSDKAIALRLLGIPRSAATQLADSLQNWPDAQIGMLRERLKGMAETQWQSSLGESRGEVYRRVWRVLEGLE